MELMTDNGVILVINCELTSGADAERVLGLSLFSSYVQYIQLQSILACCVVPQMNDIVSMSVVLGWTLTEREHFSLHCTPQQVRAIPIFIIIIIIMFLKG